MYEEITDYTLLSFLKQKMHEDTFAYTRPLHSLKFCAVRVIKAPAHRSAVLVLTNGKDSKIWGVQKCKSPWACPVCSAARMSKEAGRIASAIDALKERGQRAFMITFGVPHLKTFSFKITYKILQETWHNFTAQGRSQSQQKYNCFAQFNEQFNCTYRIRVGESTYGQNGHHPHYHCLFFVDSNKLQKVLDWQDRFSKVWFESAKRSTIRVLKQEAKKLGITEEEYAKKLRYPFPTEEKTIKEFVENFFNKTEHVTKNMPDAYISVDENGKVIAQESSAYICGWGADKELTGNFRKQASHEGHFTPHQILEKAYELRSTNKEECNRLLHIYFEYALGTFKKYRVRLSPGLGKIIIQWRQTQAYTESLKKKAENHEQLRWKTVCWFKESQWFEICHCCLLPQILKLARAPDGYEKICELLLQYSIDIRENGTYDEQEFIENEIVNAHLAKIA